MAEEFRKIHDFSFDLVLCPRGILVNYTVVVFVEIFPHTSKGRYMNRLVGELWMLRSRVDDERAKGNLEHGLRLAKFRKTAGLSQQELADKIGVAQPVISRYEKGQRKLYDDMLAELAKALKVTPNDILGIAPSKCVDSDASSLSKRMITRLKKIETLPRRAQDHLIGMLDMALKGAKN